MLVNIVAIGNSRGIRLPKAMLQQLDLGTQAQLTMEADRLIIQPLHQPRQGWGEAFKALAAAGHADSPGLKTTREVKNRFDDEEWSW